MTTLKKLLAVTTFFSVTAIREFEPALADALATNYEPAIEDPDDENTRLVDEFNTSTPLAVLIKSDIESFEELTQLADDYRDAIDRLYARVETLTAEAQKFKDAA